MWPLVLESVKTCGDSNACFTEFIDFSSFSLSNPKIVGWSFRSLAFRGTARRLTLGTNLQNKLHCPKKDQSLINFVGAFIPCMASLVCDLIPLRLGWITCPQLLIFLAKSRHFFTLSVTSASCRTAITVRTWLMSSCGDLKKIAMLPKYTRASYCLIVGSMTSVVP